MKVYVTIETFGCIIEDVCCFQNGDDAAYAEDHWMDKNDIKNEDDRQVKSDKGTEFKIFETEVDINF